MTNGRRALLPTLGLIAVAALFLAASPDARSASVEQQRADVQKTAKDTLDRLYKAEPAARKAVERAAGYAVFSAFGTKIFLAGGGSGSGLAVNNRTKQTTYMKMVEVQAGLGLGIKKFRLIWVFENAKDFDAFVNSGWELGAQTSAAAKMGSEGGAFAGAVSVKPGVWLYQLTDDGLALELTAKGTKYYKNDELN
jgi:lipid-binding SYLF domain-containing protein